MLEIQYKKDERGELQLCPYPFERIEEDAFIDYLEDTQGGRYAAKAEQYLDSYGCFAHNGHVYVKKDCE